MSRLPPLDITNLAWRAFGDAFLASGRLFRELGEDAIIHYIQQHKSDELTNYFSNPPNGMDPEEIADEIGWRFFDMCHDFWKWYWEHYPSLAENLDENLVIEVLHEHEYHMGWIERGDEPYGEVSRDDRQFEGCVALAVHAMIFTYLWEELRPFLIESRDMEIA